MEMLWKFLDLVFTNAAVQTLVIGAIVVGIGFLAKRFLFAKKLALVVAEAYAHAEEIGLVQGLKGYQKFDPFMDKLVEKFRAEFGKEITPEAKAEAVKQMEKIVKAENLGK